MSTKGTEDEESRSSKIRELYRYDKMSNQVLKVDRRFQTVQTDPLRDADLSNPKSVSGLISIKDMGTRVQHGMTEDKVDRARREVQLSNKKMEEKRSPNAWQMQSNATVLDFRTTPSGSGYCPTDTENGEVYENILRWVTDLLGDDVPHDIILEMADTFIQMLKSNDDKADGFIDEKREEIESELDLRISPARFTELFKLVRRLTDYGHTADEAEGSGVPILTTGTSDTDGEEDNLNALEQEVIIAEEEEREMEGSITGAPTDTPSGKARLVFNGESDDIIEFKIPSSQRLPISLVNETSVKRLLKQWLEGTYKGNTTIDNVCDNIIHALVNSKEDPEQWQKVIGDYLDPHNQQELIDYLQEEYQRLSWGLRLSYATHDEKIQILSEMSSKGLDSLSAEFESGSTLQTKKAIEDTDVSNDDEDSNDRLKKRKTTNTLELPPTIDLDNFKLDQSRGLMTVTRVTLPEGSFKRIKSTYEEIHIPPPEKSIIDYDLISISELPEWARKVFPSEETQYLNAIQSKVYPIAFKTDKNMLVCSPTGSGKTNIAMLCVLRALSKYYNEESDKLSLKRFKVVYIAPLKALVHEQLGEFQRRLGPLGIKVSELTGDTKVNRREIDESHILIATPEKWDIITRKLDDSSLTHSVQLIIIDEIHLLHDKRGPVIESIVARTLWSKYAPSVPRIVGLSATLPNFTDVQKFLRVPEEGLFNFDSSYRPCPLSQQFCGIKERNSLKRLAAMNEACFDKVLESLEGKNQVIIFVHSRAETARTAKWLKDKFFEEERGTLLLHSETGSQDILKSESQNVQDPNLQGLIPYSIGIHHAGLSKNDRTLSEDLFADGLLKILVSTATLAWGVNLPAHTVIIKGTDVYSPDLGIWVQLSVQDVIQMLGRAGRPRYDTHGEGIIITNQSDVQYYLTILNEQLPIESQFVSKLVDNLNAEVVLGNVKSRTDGIDWLSYTYLFVRMLTSPDLYNVKNLEDDPTLYALRESLIHTALQILHDRGLVLYNPYSGLVEPTELGRIASYFYIESNSISLYSKELNERSTQMDVFRIFSQSSEFKYIIIRQEERKEFGALYEKVPIPIKETIDDPLSKVNVLLQAYISNMKFEGFALNADMVFIQQNAGRLLRAMYELCLRSGWPNLTKLLLNLCKSVENRMWGTSSPFRQFKRCPLDVIKKAEASTIPWVEYLSLQTPSEVGRAIRLEKYGKLAYDLLKRFPQVELKCAVQPITPSLITFDLEIQPNWIWDTNLHGSGEPFVIVVEDVDGSNILYYDSIIVKPEQIGSEILLDFSVQLTQAQQKRLPPNIFVSVISERWYHSELQVAVHLDNIIMPRKFSPPNELERIEPIDVSVLGSEEFANIFEFEKFNHLQSNVFEAVYESDDNLFVGAPKGSGKTVLAELALLHHWKKSGGRAVFISPNQKMIDATFKSWEGRFSELAGGKVIGKLEGNPQLDLRTLTKSHLTLSTPSQFDAISRRWKQRKIIQNLELLIFDDIHELNNGMAGAVYETIISRMIFVKEQLSKNTRIIALSTCLSDAQGLAAWIGIDKSNVFNFSPHDRAEPIRIHLQEFENIAHKTVPLSMVRRTFETLYHNADSSATPIVYVADRAAAIDVGLKFSQFAQMKEWDLVHTDNDQLEVYLTHLRDLGIKKLLRNGIGILYRDMDKKDMRIIRKLYAYGALSVLLITSDLATLPMKSNTVIVLGTQIFEEKEQRLVNYPVSILLEMVGNAERTSATEPGKVFVLISGKKRPFYKKFLEEPLPIESFMYFHIHDFLINEISNSTIQTRQDCVDWITYTYFYRRIHANPTFYGVKDVSAQGISAYLTELVESALDDLIETTLVETEDIKGESIRTSTSVDASGTILPLNGCLISAHNNISFSTMKTLIEGLSNDSTSRDILEVLSQASEFDTIRVGPDDYTKLLKLQNVLPMKFSRKSNVDITAFKTFILLQAYFSRLELPLEFQLDLNSIIQKADRLISAVVDILAGNGMLNATRAMDISQMIIQGCWDIDSPLRQIPYFDKAILEKCAAKNIETVYDIMALEDEDREEVLTLPHKKLLQVAAFINTYPNIEMKYTFTQGSSIKVGETKSITVNITRDAEPETLEVVSEKYPGKKLEHWWIAIGERARKELYAVKKVSLSKITQEYELSFVIEEAGMHTLTIWCICDSYLDADKEVSFDIEAV